MKQLIGIFEMPESNLDKLNPAELWSFLVVLITGAIGGCAAGFTNGINQRGQMVILSLLGYAITGIFGSLIMFGISSFSTYEFASLENLVLWSLTSGFATALSLCGTNVVFKIVLKKLGIELEVKVKRTKNKSKEV